MANDSNDVKDRLNHLFRIATTERQPVQQKSLARDGLSTTKISRMLSGEIQIKRGDADNLAEGFSSFEINGVRLNSDYAKSYIFDFLWNGSDPQGRMSSRDSRINSIIETSTLIEKQIFHKARPPYFKFVPVSVAPSILFTPGIDPLHVFYETPRGQANRVRVTISENQSITIDERDIAALEQAISGDAGLSEAERLSMLKRVEFATSKSNPYLRLASVRIRPLDPTSGTVVVTLTCERSGYHVGALGEMAEQIGNHLTQISDKLAERNLANLAVRVALVAISVESMQTHAKPFKDVTREIILHRRNDRVFTFKSAWDVSAAGYIDYLKHVSDVSVNEIDVSKAARAELNEELGIPTSMLPTEEHFTYFGLSQNTETGQIDCLSQVHVDKRMFARIVKSMKPDEGEVAAVETISLTPEGVAEFLGHDPGLRMVPSAVATIILCLRHAGFSEVDIISELGEPLERIYQRGGFLARHNA